MQILSCKYVFVLGQGGESRLSQAVCTTIPGLQILPAAHPHPFWTSYSLSQGNTLHHAAKKPTFFHYVNLELASFPGACMVVALSFNLQRMFLAGVQQQG